MRMLQVQEHNTTENEMRCSGDLGLACFSSPCQWLYVTFAT
jgi:hypothetical protein